MSNPLPFVWYQLPSSKFCAVRRLQGLPEDVDFAAGLSRQRGFPDGTYFEMDPRYPKQVTLADNVYNAERLPVMSTRLAAAVASFAAPDVELLPVEIRDHKGKAVKEQYQILSALGVVDCIDRERSELSWNVSTPDLISDIASLVLRPEALDPRLPFFRVAHMTRWTLVRADVADQLAQQGFTGFELRALDEFTV